MLEQPYTNGAVHHQQQLLGSGGSADYSSFAQVPPRGGTASPGPMRSAPGMERTSSAARLSAALPASATSSINKPINKQATAKVGFPGKQHDCAPDALQAVQSHRERGLLAAQESILLFVLRIDAMLHVCPEMILTAAGDRNNPACLVSCSLCLAEHKFCCCCCSNDSRNGDLRAAGSFCLSSDDWQAHLS